MAMTKDQLIEEIKGMSVLELAELVKALDICWRRLKIRRAA